MTSEVEPALEARGISKSYGSIDACVDVSLAMYPGEITSLIGDNGAGKSTLVKILTGAVKPDHGTLHLDGKAVRFADPLDARMKGVEVVYQELALAPNLDVAANVFLGRELQFKQSGLLRVLNRRTMRRLAEEEVSALQINLPGIDALVGSMSGGQRQCVAIARSAFWCRQVVIMDEPTAALGLRESGAVLDLIRRIRDRGVAVGLVSHSLPHVAELSDHVIVMRHGRKVADLRHESPTVSQLMTLILEGGGDDPQTI
ncbi:MAG: ATP-binding cassette domain-containing protein [Actinomycetales bacterium]|nr:ATP-binding cassette domain-containing protein [Actinomycetales bacterium]